jgi:hypothetical protein
MSSVTFEELGLCSMSAESTTPAMNQGQALPAEDSTTQVRAKLSRFLKKQIRRLRARRAPTGPRNVPVVVQFQADMFVDGNDDVVTKHRR